jgi:hypothetical protein
MSPYEHLLRQLAADLPGGEYKEFEAPGMLLSPQGPERTPPIFNVILMTTKAILRETDYIHHETRAEQEEETRYRLILNIIKKGIDMVETESRHFNQLIKDQSVTP